MGGVSDASRQCSTQKEIYCSLISFGTNILSGAYANRGVVTGYLIMPPEKLMHLSRSILLDKDHLTRYFLRTSFLKNRNESFEKKPYPMTNL